jgi:hypothetical protein
MKEALNSSKMLILPDYMVTEESNMKCSYHGNLTLKISIIVVICHILFLITFLFLCTHANFVIGPCAVKFACK